MLIVHLFLLCDYLFEKRIRTLATTINSPSGNFLNNNEYGERPWDFWYEQRPVPPVRDNKISTYRRPSLRFFSSDKIGYGGSDRFDEDNYISFTDPPNMREVHPPGILPIGKPVTTEEYEEFGPYGKNEQQYDLEKEDYEAPSYGPIAPDRKGPKRKQKPQFMRILPEPSHDRETQRTSYKNEREQEKKNRRPYEENNLSQGGQPSTPRPGRPHVTSGYYVRILPRPSHNRERQRTSHKNEREREEKNRRPYEENNLSQGGPPSIPGQIEVPPSSHEFEEGEPNEPYQPEGSEQNPYLGQPKPKNAGEEKAEKVVPHTNLPLIELATRSPHVTIKVTPEDMDKRVPESENEPNYAISKSNGKRPCCPCCEENWTSEKGEYSVNPRGLSTGLEAIPPSDLPLPVYAKPLPPVPDQAVLTPYALTSSMSEGYSGSIPYPNDNVPNSFGIAYSTFDSPNGYAIPLASLGQPATIIPCCPVVAPLCCQPLMPSCCGLQSGGCCCCAQPAIPPCFRACPACPCRRRVMMASRFKRQSSNDASCQCTKCTADGQAALGTILARTKRELIPSSSSASSICGICRSDVQIKLRVKRSSCVPCMGRKKRQTASDKENLRQKRTNGCHECNNFGDLLRRYKRTLSAGDEHGTTSDCDSTCCDFSKCHLIRELQLKGAISK